MELLPVVALVGGTVCLYGAIKNKNPMDVLKAALTGNDPADARPLMQDSASPLTDGSSINLPGTIPTDKLPGTPQADGDARTDGKPWNNPLIPDWLENLLPKPKTGVLPNYGNGTANGGGTPGNGAV